MTSTHFIYLHDPPNLPHPPNHMFVHSLMLRVSCDRYCVLGDQQLDKWLGRLQPLSVIFISLGFKGNLLVNAGTKRGTERFHVAFCNVSVHGIAHTHAHARTL